MQSKYSILLPESTYHVYNRANGSERLFRSAENYRYFLQKYEEYISPIADTFCYCLMPNHFHFLVRIRTEAEIRSYFAAARERKNLQGFQNLEDLRAEELSKLISDRFSNFFNAYAKAFNKMYDRKGSLFMHTFRRKQVHDMEYLRNLVHYIHYNPVESNLSHSLTDWQYSSYRYILSSETNFPNSKEVISWFDDLENFRHFHQQMPLKESATI